MKILSASRADELDVEDLRKFATFLGPFSSLSLQEFCNGYGEKPVAAKKAKPAQIELADSPRATAYVNQLKSDPSRQADVIDIIEGDKKISLVEIKAIVAELLGTASGYSSKKKAIEGLRGWEQRNRARENRGPSVEGGF